MALERLRINGLKIGTPQQIIEMPKKLIMFLVITCVNFSCRYDDLSKKPKVKEDHGFVIGFNPCEQYTGRVMALTTEQDTIISYNFPDSIYTFPSSFFSAYRHRYLFPDSVLDKYPINITYRLAESSEKEYFLCSGAINTASFLHDVKDRQVVILRITKD